MKHWKSFQILIAIALLVSACDKEKDRDDGEVVTETLPLLDGLAGDADNRELLFFTSTAAGASGLYAYDPSSPEEKAVLVDGDAEFGSAGYHFYAMHGGNLSVDNLSLSGFYVSHVLYSRFIAGGNLGDGNRELRRVSTDPAQAASGWQRVSSEDSSSVILGERFVQHDLSNPLQSSYVYRDLSTSTGSWLEVRLGDDENAGPRPFGDGLVVSVPVWDVNKGKPGGWLAIDNSTDKRLVLLNTDRELVGPVAGEDDTLVDNLVSAHLLASLDHETTLLALVFAGGTAEEQKGEVWAWTQEEANSPGYIKSVLDANGEKLMFPASLFSNGAPQLPAANLRVVKNGALYFANSAEMFSFGESPSLTRVDKAGWKRFEYPHPEAGETPIPTSFLIDAGKDALVWFINERLEKIDVSKVDKAESSVVFDQKVSTFGSKDEITTPITTGREGWFFYNRDGRYAIDDSKGRKGDYSIAVAEKIDGTERITIQDARWIGASTSGRAPVLGQIETLELGEVFLFTKEHKLAAVSAVDPARGMVELGKLPETIEGVRMFGLAPGPHRLLQVVHGEKSHEVIYVNTRERNSLKHLMDTPTLGRDNSQYTRPVELF